MATMADLDPLAIALPQTAKELSDDGRPAYFVHGKLSAPVLDELNGLRRGSHMHVANGTASIDTPTRSVRSARRRAGSSRDPRVGARPNAAAAKAYEHSSAGRAFASPRTPPGRPLSHFQQTATTAPRSSL